jgi:glucokinase
MKNLAVFDFGGSSIKIAAWTGAKLVGVHSSPTPKNLVDLYRLLTFETEKINSQISIEGVAISTPGAVDKATGVIRGLSAIPYIHNFNIQQELKRRLNKPVTLENDANCAALAEMAAGVGYGKNSLVSIVIGSGIGGAIILDKRIWHGSHLFGGEFGYMLSNSGNKSFSDLCSPVKIAKAYNKNNQTNFSGKEVFEKGLSKEDKLAHSLVDQFFKTLTVHIYNIQFAIDPDVIAIGGAISNNPFLLPRLRASIAKLVETNNNGGLNPNVVACQYKGSANLRGAVVDFEQTIK